MMPTRLYPVTPAADGRRQNFRPVIAHGGWTSLRFAWIHFDLPPGPIIVHGVRGLCQLLPCDYQGNFECADEALTRIWEMCAYSAHAVMAQPLDDGTGTSGRLQTLCLDRVDRFPWAGDTRVIQTAVLDVFGQYDLVRSNLDAFIPRGTRPIPDLTTIAPYTLDWALAVMDYGWCSGDTAFLRERWDDLVAVIDKYDPLPPRLEEIVPPTGASHLWMFFDWDRRIGRSINAQTAAAFTGKYVQTCRALAETARFSDRPETMRHAQELARKHTAQWRERHLKEWTQTYGIHAVTNLLLGEVLFTPEEQAEAMAHGFASRQKRWTNTPYFGSHILTLLAKLGRHAEALELLHDYWGTMIEAGATTVWEEWDPSVPLPVNAQPPQFGPPDTWGGLSLLQPAGVGPARWLLRELLGIGPESPGYTHVRIMPHTAGLAWARGSVATPGGSLGVAWTDTPSHFELTVDAPDTVRTLTLVLPNGREYRLDGHAATPENTWENRAIFKITPGHHVLAVTKTQHHSARPKTGGTTPKAPT